MTASFFSQEKAAEDILQGQGALCEIQLHAQIVHAEAIGIACRLQDVPGAELWGNGRVKENPARIRQILPAYRLNVSLCHRREIIWLIVHKTFASF